MNLVRIKEIFYSLQGESRSMGLPTVFIRFSGCPLRCYYCDTAYAFKGGEYYSIEELMQKVQMYRTPWVTVTGGEPLAQKNSFLLLTQLAEAGYQVSLETSGAIDISPVDERISIVMDLKTPTSGEANKNHWHNLNLIQAKDQLKFVLSNRLDYDWSKDIIEQYDLYDRGCEILFSPVHHELDPSLLAEWILADQIPVRLQIQLHKILWGNAPGH